MYFISIDSKAARQLQKLDKTTQIRILKFLKHKVAQSNDPRSLGKSLSGSVLGSYTRYRVGDYRIICDIQDSVITVNVLKVGHRKEVYRG